jgi:transcription elongation factor Elf1
MLSTESVQQAKNKSALERATEISELATRSMKQAQAISRAEPLVSDAFIGNVADDSGNDRRTAFERSNIPRRRAEVDLACPSCGNKPFVIAGMELPAVHSITDFSGLSCADCGHVVSNSEVEWAMKTVIYKLVTDSFGSSGGKD